MEVYRRLMAAFGPQGWWPGAEQPLEVCIGAILAQNTAWRNADRALARLKDAGGMSIEALATLPPDELTELLRPSGTYRSKSLTVQAFVAHVGERYEGDLARMLARPMSPLRAELLAIRGIGPETADDIVLYAAGHPSFVIDAYTRRIFTRIGVRLESRHLRVVADLLHGRLPADVTLFNEYHALLVRLGSRVCQKRAPRCSECPLQPLCAVGRERLESNNQGKMNNNQLGEGWASRRSPTPAAVPGAPAAASPRPGSERRPLRPRRGGRWRWWRSSSCPPPPGRPARLGGP